MSDIKQIELLAKSHSLEFKDLGGGHVQISGHGKIINYWPNSKNRTAHIVGGDSIKHCGHYDVIKMCLSQGKTITLKPGKKPSENGPDFDLKPITVNPSGIKHFYTGIRPPWDFPSKILCESDNLRIAAARLNDQAVLMDAEMADNQLTPNG